MKRRHERCALTAEGQILASKIRDHGDAGFGRDHVGIADLERKRGVEARPVPDRLAVAADRAHVPRGDAGLGEQSVDRVGEKAAQRHIGPAEPVDLIVSGPAQREQLGLQLGRKRQRVGSDQLGPRAEAHEGGVDSVHARAGKRADEQVGVAGWRRGFHRANQSEQSTEGNCELPRMNANFRLDSSAY